MGLSEQDRFERLEMRQSAHTLILSTLAMELAQHTDIDLRAVRDKVCAAIEANFAEPGLTSAGHRRLQISLDEVETILQFLRGAGASPQPDHP